MCDVTDGCLLHQHPSPLLKSSLETLDPTHALWNAGKECLQWGESKLVNDELCCVFPSVSLHVCSCSFSPFQPLSPQSSSGMSVLSPSQVHTNRFNEKNARPRVDLRCQKMINLLCISSKKCNCCVKKVWKRVSKSEIKCRMCLKTYNISPDLWPWAEI